MTFKRAVSGVTAAVLALLSGVATAGAAEADPPAQETITAVVDPETNHEYPGTSGSSVYFASTGHAGRVWTDKTVLTGQIGAEDDGPGSGEPRLLAEDELAVSLSALGSTRHLVSKEPTPIDVVLILDVSGSMAFCAGLVNGQASTSACSNRANSRAQAMVEAVNTAIDIIVEDNPANRVALVSFGPSASTLRGLSTPQMISNDTRYVRLGPTNESMRLQYADSLGETKYVDITGGTNTQLGLATGMNLLADQDPSSVTGTNQHLPNVVLLTDGVPTYSSSSANWWAPNPLDTNNGNGNSPYYGNGFKAAMTASYLKNKIADVYGDPSNKVKFDPKVYTVGLGVTAMSTNDGNLSKITLDPKTHYDTTGNSFFTNFTSAFKTYQSGGRPSVTVNNANQTTYRVEHPTGTADAYDVTDIKYNDQFYAPLTEDDLKDAFTEIAEQIVAPAANPPVQTKLGSESTDGYVTFTDTLGDFMELTDMNRLTFCSLEAGATDTTKCDSEAFFNPTKTTSDLIDTYTFDGSYKANDLYPRTDVGSIVITVKRSQDPAIGDEVTVKIPSALLPMRDSYITVDADGNPSKMSVEVSHPVHLYYVVAPKTVTDAESNKRSILDYLGDPLALNAVFPGAGSALAQYVRDNAAPGGKVRFYSNDFTGVAGNREAKARATFLPADGNLFYRFGTDTTLYADNGANQAITKAAWEGYGPDARVWYRYDSYWQTENTAKPVEKRSVILETTKEMLQRPGSLPLKFEGALEVVTAPAGMRDYARAANMDHLKCTDLTWSADGVPTCGATSAAANATGTDPAVRKTTYDGQSVVASLGNNGYLETAVPGRLTITKEVQHAPGLTPDPTEMFGFTVTLSGTASTTTAYPYAVYKVTDTTAPLRSGTIVSGGKIELADGEVAQVMGLPHGATYSVTETTVPTGYVKTSPEGAATGTITTPQVTSVDAKFVNTYTPSPTPALAAPTIIKSIEGSNWPDVDVFEAELCPSPSGTCVVKPLRTTAAAPFDPIVFPAPGTYTYTIREKDGLVHGFSYSAARYRWEVVVADDGEGALKVTSQTLTQTVDDKGAVLSTPVGATVARFTNTYAVDSVSGSLYATKFVRDTTLVGSPLVDPAKPHEFRYWYLQDTAPEGAVPPTFMGGLDDVRVMSDVGDTEIASPQLTFRAEHIGHSYYYAVTEIPNEAYSGVKYDTSAFIYKLTVSAGKTTGDVATVQVTPTRCRTEFAAITPQTPLGTCTDDSTEPSKYSEGTSPVFLNTYSTPDVTKALEASKVLTGRPWTGDDVFTFELSANDEKTIAALSRADGDEEPAVSMPADTTVEVTSADVVGGSAPVVFDEITFRKVGTYQFRIQEQKGSAVGVAYDGHWLVYDVEVSDLDRDGDLDVVATPRTGDSAKVFTNRWTGSEIHDGVTLVKSLTGRDLRSNEFSFDVVPVDQASAVRAGMSLEGVTVTNGQGHSDLTKAVVLGPQTYTESELGNTYAYTVTEVKGTRGGVTYDPATYTVTIRPVFDEASGELDVRTTVTGGGAETTVSALAGEQAVVTFVNTYQAASTTASPQFSKAVHGRDWNDGESFVFEMRALDGAPAPTAGEVVVTADSAAGFGFGAIEFTSAGVYRYVVSEVVPDEEDPDLIYDPDEAIVTVTVTDSLDGSLRAVVGYDGNQGFVNIYDRLWDGWRMQIGKTLIGDSQEPGDFTFRVQPHDQAAAVLAGMSPDGETFTTTAAAAAGEQSVMEWPLAAPLGQDYTGLTYCYTFSEELPDEPDPAIVYDETVYDLCAKVDVDGAGVLIVTTTITGTLDGEDVFEQTFVNRSDDAESVWPLVPFTNVGEEPSWTLSKTSDRADDVPLAPGDVVEYTLEVRNTSEGRAVTGVVVTDDLAGVLDAATLGEIVEPYAGTVARPASDGTTLVWTIGTLAPNQVETLTYKVTVNADAKAYGATLRNEVWGTGKGIDVDRDGTPDDLPPTGCTEEEPCSTEHRVKNPSWKVTKSSDSEAVPGGTLTYQLTVTNTGDVPLWDATVIDGPVEHDGVTDIWDFVDEGGSWNGRYTVQIGDQVQQLRDTTPFDGLQHTIAELAVGEHAVVTFTVQLPAQFESVHLRNTALGSLIPDPAEPGEPDGLSFPPADCAVPNGDEPCSVDHVYTPTAEWTAAKTAETPSGTSTVEPGDTVVYTLTVENTGLHSPVTGVVVTDDLSEVLADGLVTLEPLVDPEQGSVSLAGTTLTWDVGTLAAGERITFTYSVTVSTAEGAWGLTLHNAAWATGRGPTDEVLDPVWCTEDAPCTTDHEVGVPDPEPSDEPTGRGLPAPTDPEPDVPEPASTVSAPRVSSGGALVSSGGKVTALVAAAGLLLTAAALIVRRRREEPTE